MILITIRIQFKLFTLNFQTLHDLIWLLCGSLTSPSTSAPLSLHTTWVFFQFLTSILPALVSGPLSVLFPLPFFLYSCLLIIDAHTPLPQGSHSDHSSYISLALNIVLSAAPVTI